MNARAYFTFLLAAVPALLALCVAGVPAVHGEGFPVEGSGDIPFEVDCAGFLSETGVIEEEFYVRVRGSYVNFERTKDGSREALVRLTLTFINELGDEYDSISKDLVLTLSEEPTDEDSYIVMVRHPVTPAAGKVRVTLEDRRARKRGILYMFTKEKKTGVVEAPIEVVSALPGVLSMSDIQFAWSIVPAESALSTSFPKSGLEVIPNPSRNYGLRNPNLSVYLEVYDRTGLPDAVGKVHYGVATSVLNSRREPILSDTERIVAASGEWVHTSVVDVSALPGGTYWFRAEVWQENGGIRTLREREFEVLWYGISWQKSEQDVIDEASLFLDEETFKRFRNRAPGERETFLEEFWRERDPSPGTARNETKEELYRRILHANKSFSFFQKGMLTDRGRIYVRYGEPDLVERQVVPTTGDQADIAVDQLVGRENIDPRIQQKLGGRDKRSYEVWIYNMRGRPLFDTDREMMTQSLGMKFVFIDDAGVGNFILEYSTDYSKYR
ncbi:MAG: GWxTD domain-containing protein [Candidatus Eisenbacteria bacterium]